MARSGRSRTHRRRNSRRRRIHCAPREDSRQAETIEPGESPGGEAGGGPLFQRVFPVGFGLAEDPLALRSESVRLDTASDTSSGHPHAESRQLEAVDVTLRPEASVGTPDPAEIRELVVSRLGYLHHQIETLQSERRHRVREEKRETLVLASGLAVVLLFCFMAFYLNQVEVRDLETGLRQEIESQAEHTAGRFERSLDGLRVKALPALRASLEERLIELEREERERVAAAVDELRQLDEDSRAEVDASLRQLRERVDGLRELADEMHRLQQKTAAGPPPPEPSALRPEYAQTDERESP